MRDVLQKSARFRVQCILQEHREAAWLAEEHANMLEEQNQKLEEECRRLQAQLTRSRPNDKAGSLRDSRDEDMEKLSEKGLGGRGLPVGHVHSVHSNGGSVPTSPSSWSPFRRRTARLSASEDLEQLLSTVSAERDAAVAEKAASEARCEARLREMDEEVTALRLLLEEETARTDTMAQHIDYLGSVLEDSDASECSAHVHNFSYTIHAFSSSCLGPIEGFAHGMLHCAGISTLAFLHLLGMSKGGIYTCYCTHTHTHIYIYMLYYIYIIYYIYRYIHIDR